MYHYPHFATLYSSLYKNNPQLHANTLANIRSAASQRPHRNVAILLDTKGPEIRTGMLVDGKPVKLQKGQILEITTDYEHLGDNVKIACSYKSLPTSVKVGSSILCADGSLVMKVCEGSLKRF
jgi:pyruvate kinase